MGSGRTNVVRTIFGLDKHAGGSISVRNQTRDVTPAERLAQSVGYLSEDRKNEGLAITLSIADNVTMTRFRILFTPGMAESLAAAIAHSGLNQFVGGESS